MKHDHHRFLIDRVELFFPKKTNINRICFTCLGIYGNEGITNPTSLSGMYANQPLTSRLNNGGLGNPFLSIEINCCTVLGFNNVSERRTLPVEHDDG